MIDPIDLEAKYLRWLSACPAARRLDAAIPIPDRADHAHPTAAGYRKMGEAMQ